jgi:translation initiation factor 4E
MTLFLVQCSLTMSLSAKAFPITQLDRTDALLHSTGNLSLSTSQTDTSNQPRDYSSLRRNGPQSSHGRASNPFSATTPGGGLTSPTGGGSSAFGLGSGAFASFGSAKTPKTSGNPFDMAMGTIGAGSKTPAAEKTSKEALRSAISRASEGGKQGDTQHSHALREAWTYWTRPPISKANGYIEYEKTLHSMASVATVEDFWHVYKHVKKPSELPAVTDIHFFKRGIRPIWEDEENKAGGKWILRLKKGIADRYWDDILMGCVGDQFGDYRDCVNGAVLSVRNGEDIISIWTSTTGQKVLKLR